jgi:hypothetical protein
LLDLPPHIYKHSPLSQNFPYLIPYKSIITTLTMSAIVSSRDPNAEYLLIGAYIRYSSKQDQILKPKTHN